MFPYDQILDKWDKVIFLIFMTDFMESLAFMTYLGKRNCVFCSLPGEDEEWGKGAQKASEQIFLWGFHFSVPLSWP